MWYFRNNSFNNQFCSFWKTNFICYTKWHFIWHSPSWGFTVRYVLRLWCTLKPENQTISTPEKYANQYFENVRKSHLVFKWLPLRFVVLRHHQSLSIENPIARVEYRFASSILLVQSLIFDFLFVTIRSTRFCANKETSFELCSRSFALSFYHSFTHSLTL